MRLWSIHPGYLDTRGLVALWREGLLAQKVLLGQTRGYRNHPQLARFRKTDDPVAAIAGYLRCVADEADTRGYHFQRSKLSDRCSDNRMTVTGGQVEYEFKHLLGKLKTREPARYKELKTVKRVRLHPLFRRVKGAIEEWEVVRNAHSGNGHALKTG